MLRLSAMPAAQHPPCRGQSTRHARHRIIEVTGLTVDHLSGIGTLVRLPERSRCGLLSSSGRAVLSALVGATRLTRPTT